jgi:hypothetical protein
MDNKRTTPATTSERPTQPKKERAEYNVTPQQFIEAWQRSDSPQQVADRLKMPKNIVLARASMYRVAGIKVKKMKRRNKRYLDVSALNAFIEDLEAQGNSPT